MILKYNFKKKKEKKKKKKKLNKIKKKFGALKKISEFCKID